MKYLCPRDFRRGEMEEKMEMARKKRNQFDVDEIYRGLRTNIEFSQMDDAIQVINVVSTIPNEGKSTIACNLARIMAGKYKNILKFLNIIDAANN